MQRLGTAMINSRDVWVLCVSVPFLLRTLTVFTYERVLFIDCARGISFAPDREGISRRAILVRVVTVARLGAPV